MKKEMKEKINTLYYEANKNKLTKLQLQRREEIQTRFFHMYGRNINVFSDCEPVESGIY